MKRSLLGCFLILFLCSFDWYKDQGLASYFASADSIYLVRVTSLEDGTGKATLSVLETLRGKPVASLNLGVNATFKPKTEWFILSCRSWRENGRKDFVGGFWNGKYSAWTYAPVFREDGKIYVYGNVLENGHYGYDKFLDGAKCLSLDHIKKLLLKNPTKQPLN